MQKRFNRLVKGQYSIMEYLFLSLFVIIIILGLLFFIFVFQVGQNSFEIERNIESQLFTLTSRVVVSPFLVKKDSLFDDAKLTAMQSLGCGEFKKIFGRKSFLTIKDLNMTKDVIVGVDVNSGYEIPTTGRECTDANYGEFLPGGTIDGVSVPDENLCNYWEFCYDDTKEFRGNVIPINILRRTGKILSSGAQEQADIGILTVGVYIE